MSDATAQLYGPAVIVELSATLVRLSRASNLMDARVGHLLAQWSVSSPHYKARLGQATVEGGHNVLRAAKEAAIREYTESLITPLGAMELVVALKALKSGFGALSEFFNRHGLQYSLKIGRPFPRPICTREAFDVEWQARCTLLELAPPVTADTRPSPRRSWPIASWVNYVQSRNALRDGIDWSRPLMFIVRGDAFPCARGSWSHLLTWALRRSTLVPAPANQRTTRSSAWRCAVTRIWPNSVPYGVTTCRYGCR